MSSTTLRPLLRTPFTPLTRPTTPLLPHLTTLIIPHRNANLLRRPQRPWLNDQIIMLSDGSAYKQLTTSPRGVFRSTKDVRNHPLWNPSIQKLMNVEEDEAGKLRAFRERFGRMWDNREMVAKENEEREAEKRKREAATAEDGEKVVSEESKEERPVDNLMDLITGGYESLIKVKKGKGGRRK